MQQWFLTNRRIDWQSSASLLRPDTALVVRGGTSTTSGPARSEYANTGIQFTDADSIASSDTLQFSGHAAIAAGAWVAEPNFRAGSPNRSEDAAAK